MQYSLGDYSDFLAYKTPDLAQSSHYQFINSLKPPIFPANFHHSAGLISDIQHCISDYLSQFGLAFSVKDYYELNNHRK